MPHCHDFQLFKNIIKGWNVELEPHKNLSYSNHIAKDKRPHFRSNRGCFWGDNYLIALSCLIFFLSLQPFRWRGIAITWADRQTSKFDTLRCNSIKRLNI